MRSSWSVRRGFQPGISRSSCEPPSTYPVSRNRRSRPAEKTSAAAPDGCDPKVFADEIAYYLATEWPPAVLNVYVPPESTQADAEAMTRELEQAKVDAWSVWERK